MSQTFTRTAGLQALCLVAGIALMVGGCAQKTPLQKLEEARSQYTATLNGWTVLEPPAPAEEPVAMEEGEVASEEMAAGEEMEEGMPPEEGMPMEEAAEPAPRTVLLDVLVHNESREKLDGITLDVSLAGASGAEKRHWRLWVDTSSIERGPGSQIDEKLEDVVIEEGDGFHVEVRNPVPTSERGEYREYEGIS